jgi:bacteriocin-like protein
MDVRAYNVTELSADELQTVTGGESFWYYIGYAIGYLAGAAAAAEEAGACVNCTA